jgi:hypothetical protein
MQRTWGCARLTDSGRDSLSSVAQCKVSWRQLAGEPARSKCVELRGGFIELSAADTHGIDAAGWDLLIANGYLQRVGSSELLPAAQRPKRDRSAASEDGLKRRHG